MGSSSDTIFAAASGFGRAALAVIRISGPGTRTLLETIADRGLPPPRRLALRTLRHPQSGEALDQGLVVWMPAPNSFSGEDQAELHIHGGLAVRSAVLKALAGQDRLRAAEPGEFTRRAFLNGRLALDQAEGLADLIDAETEAQRRQALRQLGGKLGSLAEGWRDEVIQTLALLEAALDFSDEGDVPGELEARAAEKLSVLADAISAHLTDAHRGERLREGFVVVLAGPPNAGKSTLLNALAKRDVAIVSPIPGTTRDAIELHCDVGGLPVTFIDTAGLRDSDHPVEREGVSRARARAESADLVLWLMAPDTDDAGSGPTFTVPMLRVATKADLADARTWVDLNVSAQDGSGMASLLDAIETRAGAALGHGDALVTRERHRNALERTREALARAQAALGGEETELAAEDVRLAVRALGQISGRVDVEDVLDRVFSSFCIGK